MEFRREKKNKHIFKLFMERKQVLNLIITINERRQVIMRVKFQNHKINVGSIPGVDSLLMSNAWKVHDKPEWKCQLNKKRTKQKYMPSYVEIF